MTVRTFLRYDGRSVELAAPIVVGRSSSCDVVLDDDQASRRHCRVEARGDRVLIVDLSSRNGVRVNGSAVQGEREVHHGDVIEIGASRLVVLRQKGEPRAAHPSSAATQPDALEEPAAWGAALEAFLRASERALERDERAAAEASAHSLLASLRTALLRTQVDAALVDRALRHGLQVAERYCDPYWLDRVIEVHLAARLPMSEETALRISRASEAFAPPDVPLDDYLAATARITGVSAEVRGHLSAAYCLRESDPTIQRSARDALRATLLAREPSDGRAAHAPDLFSIVVEGSWSLVDQFDRDGRRYLIACRSAPGAPTPERLTVQERQVAAHLKRGAANKEIAFELGLSTPRVGNIVRSIKRKLGVESRSEAVMLLGWAYASAPGAPDDRGRTR